jgi:hypothetical protein
VSFDAITLCVASQRVFIFVTLYFVIDSVRKLSDIPSYIVCSIDRTKTTRSWCCACWCFEGTVDIALVVCSFLSTLLQLHRIITLNDRITIIVELESHGNEGMRTAKTDLSSSTNPETSDSEAGVCRVIAVLFQNLKTTFIASVLYVSLNSPHFICSSHFPSFIRTRLLSLGSPCICALSAFLEKDRGRKVKAATV